MGNELSYMNFVSIRSIVQLDEERLMNILAKYEGRPFQSIKPLPPPNKEVVEALRAKHLIPDRAEIKSAPKSKFVENLQKISKDARTTTTLSTSPTEMYLIEYDQFVDLLSYVDLKVDLSDAELMVAIFKLIDKRGFQVIDIRHLLLSYSVLIGRDARHCIEMCFKILDRGETMLIDKEILLKMMHLLNETVMYFGDKHLPPSQIQDYVDSIFTSAGKIDGDLYYPDYTEAIANHPLMELFLSPQFQGSVRHKVMDEDQIRTADLAVRI